MTNLTKCECQITGKPKQWCDRHGCYKTPQDIKRCQRYQTNFNTWEECRSESQGEDCVTGVRRSEPEIEAASVRSLGKSNTYIGPSINTDKSSRSGGCSHCSKPKEQGHTSERERLKEIYEKRLPEQRGQIKPPNLLKQGWNFTKAVAEYVKSGGAKISEEQFAERLMICDNCEFRYDKKCLKCGCFIDLKASWASQDCPIGKWPKNRS